MDGGVAEPTIVSRSEAMSEALELAAIYARLDVPILLEGESGTGKLYVARYIHCASARRSGPFRWVHGATLKEGLAASELFGHRQGAFTGADRAREGLVRSANGGTLFFDELGKTELAVQAMLLHPIEGHGFYAVGEDQSRRADVRFIAAASEPLEPLSAAGHFVPDLFQRLRSSRVAVPPLRERREDIPDLVRQFVELDARKVGFVHRMPEFDISLVRAFTFAPWRGNVREFRDTLLKLMAFAFAQGALKVTLAHCRADLRYLVDLAHRSARPSRKEVELALERFADNKTRAAESLGVSRRTIQRRMKAPPPTEQRKPEERI